MIYKMNGYCYRKWFFYIGWVMCRCNDQPTFYYDNNPVAMLVSDPGVIYLTFGLTKKKRLLKESVK